MKNIVKIISLVFPSIFFWQIHTSPAHAWFQVCNKIGWGSFGANGSARRVSIAFHYLDTNDNRDSPYNRGWVTEGWYNLESGQCKTVYPHELWRRNNNYYVHVTGLNQGSHRFCIDTKNGFKFYENETCNFGNREEVFFNVYNTGNNSNYILNLR
jgi:uncharacterized membrane protein